MFQEIKHVWGYGKARYVKHPMHEKGIMYKLQREGTHTYRPQENKATGYRSIDTRQNKMQLKNGKE